MCYGELGRRSGMGSPVVLKAVRAGDAALLKLFLSGRRLDGADLDAAILLAVRFRQAACLQVLLEHGAGSETTLANAIEDAGSQGSEIARMLRVRLGKVRASSER